MLLRHVAEDSPELCLRSSAPNPEVLLLFLIVFFAGFFFFFPLELCGSGPWDWLSGKYLYLNCFIFVVIKTLCVCVRERERERERERGRPVEANYRIEGLEN